MSRAELIEAVAILLCVCILIPLGFGYYRPWYGALLLLALVTMVVVAVRRIKRLSDVSRDRK